MRDIKFRAWDKDENRYEYDIQNATVGDNHEYEDFDSYLHDVFDQPEKSIDVEQYTGLKDKNGKDIYEGDLLSVSVDNGWDYLQNEILPVVYSKLQAGFVCMSDNSMEFRLFNSESSIGYEYEVIGNIHKNPELLEGNND